MGDEIAENAGCRGQLRMALGHLAVIIPPPVVVLAVSIDGGFVVFLTKKETAMKVKDILKNKRRRGEILRVDAKDAVAAAVRMMVQNDTGSVAVYDGGRFIGMLTFREVLIALERDGFDKAANAKCGGLIDEERGAWATADDSVDQIRNLMTSRHIRYLPVVQDGQPTDVVSFYDVARSVAKAADFENRMLKEYIRDWPSGGAESD
ncbi:MAG: CBS domain-containing protein [Gammaproteobacteria bacterium]